MMSEIRRTIRDRLDDTGRESEEWVYWIQKEDPGLVVGIIIRCMTIASLHQDWSFFNVLFACRKSIGQHIQLEDLEEWTKRIDKTARRMLN